MSDIVVSPDTVATVRKYCESLSVSQKLDLAISSLINSKPIYGYVFQRMRRIAAKGIKTMGVGKDPKDSRINFVYDPDFVAINDVYCVVAVLEHEAHHVLRRHIDRIANNDKNKWNIAADYAVNCHLEKAWLKDVQFPDAPKKAGRLLFPENNKPNPLPEKQSAEWYYNEIPDPPKIYVSVSGQGPDGQGEKPGQGQGEKPGQGQGTLDDHSGWSEIANDSIAKNNLGEICKDAIRKGVAAGTGIGSDLLDEIVKANEPQINWKKALRYFLQKSVVKNVSFTRTRSNRRLGWKTPGRKKDYATDLVLAVDTSGSISDRDLSQFVAEMNKIVDQVGNLTVVEFDGDIRNVTANVDKVGGSWKFKGRGGTCFEPVMEYLRKHTADACVFLTDMMPFDAPTNPKCQILWVGTPGSNREWNPGFGRMVYMEKGYEN